MRTLRRNKRKFYLCKKKEENGLDLFDEPIPIWDNYVPTNTDTDLMSIGLNYPKYLRIKTDISNKEKYNVKDRCYIYKQPPLNHDVLCEGADYEVYEEPMLFINEMEVILHRLSSDDNE